MKIELKSLMGHGNISYKTPSSDIFYDYKGPFEIKDSGILIVKVSESEKISSKYQIAFTKQKPLQPINITKQENGLLYKYYEGEWSEIPEFSNEELVKNGFVNDIVPNVSERKENYGLVFTGNILIPKRDIYTFYLRSNDGSRLKIGGKTISEINGKAGLDPIFAAPSRIALEKGFHSFLRLNIFRMLQEVLFLLK